MRKISLFLLAALLAAAPVFAESVTGRGRYVSRDVNHLPAFHAVEVRGDIEVDFMQDKITSVTVSGRENLVALSDVRVENGVLVVSFTRPVRVRGEYELRVAVRAPELTAVTASQSGEFDLRGSLDANQLTLTTDADSDISMDYVNADTITVAAYDRSDIELGRVHVRQVKATADGRADVDLSGMAEEAVLINNGSGEIDADDLRAVTVRATTNASGKIKVNASEALYAQANGRGRIEYRGYPSTLRKEGNARKVVRDRDDDYDDYDD